MTIINHKITRKTGIIIPVALALWVAISSCSIDDNINNSPNAIQESKIKSIEGVYGLSISLQTAVADFYSGDRSRIASFWTWQMCAPPGIGRAQLESWNSYQQQEDGPADDMWKIAYRAVKIANDLIYYTPQVNFGNHSDSIKNTILGMAKTYKALVFGELAAFYGNIPISIKGLTPSKFVPQREAYDMVQLLLDSALEHFKSGYAYPRDLNYEGNEAKWEKTIHSLKARYFLHIKEYQSAFDEAKLGIEDPAYDLYGKYYAISGQYSPWGYFTLTETGEPIRAEANYIRLLKSEEGDNRLTAYFTPNKNNSYWGYAVHTSIDVDSVFELDFSKTVSLKKYGKYDDGFPLIRYAETQLIIAECKPRLGKSGIGELNNIRRLAGLSEYTGFDLISEILKQKYLELFLEGQSYTDMRRTGTLPEPTVPKRFIYPTSEKNANPNVPAESDALVKEILP